MPVLLTDDISFPDPALSDQNGLLAIGGDLSQERLISAYEKGIFPWYSDDTPILWWSPDPRLVLEPSNLHISKTLKRILKSKKYQITFDKAFSRVINKCANITRQNQDGTWIIPDIVKAYIKLHKNGLAHSVESWFNGELVGGLYGISMGGIFYGESMFALMPDASKVAFSYLVTLLQLWNFDLIDCQVTTSHLMNFGAHEISRDNFLKQLNTSLKKRSLQRDWSKHSSLDNFLEKHILSAR